MFDGWFAKLIPWHGFRRKPFFSSSSNLLFIRSFSLCVIFSFSGLWFGH